MTRGVAVATQLASLIQKELIEHGKHGKGHVLCLLTFQTFAQK